MTERSYLHLGGIRDVETFRHHLRELQISIPCDTEMILGEAAALRSRFRYFPSQRLTIPRGADQLHPTARGYAAWAGAIWQWLS